MKITRRQLRKLVRESLLLEQSDPDEVPDVDPIANMRTNYEELDLKVSGLERSFEEYKASMGDTAWATEGYVDELFENLNKKLNVLRAHSQTRLSKGHLDDEQISNDHA